MTDSEEKLVDACSETLIQMAKTNFTLVVVCSILIAWTIVGPFLVYWAVKP